MNLKAVSTSLCIMVTGFIVGACSERKIPLHSIYSSMHCPISQQVIKRIDSQLELKQLLEPRLNNFTSKPVTRINVDFDKQTLIVFAIGQKSTAGYELDVYKEQATVRGQKLYLPIRILQPHKDSLQAQVITSPCQVFALPYGDYTEILLDNDSDE